MASYGPVCFTKILGVNDEDSIPPKESVAKAVEENPRNGSLTLPPAPTAPGGPLGLAMMMRKFWLPGRELKIGFQGGSTWQKVCLLACHEPGKRQRSQVARNKSRGLLQSGPSTPIYGSHSSILEMWTS